MSRMSISSSLGFVGSKRILFIVEISFFLVFATIPLPKYILHFCRSECNTDLHTKKLQFFYIYYMKI